MIGTVVWLSIFCIVKAVAVPAILGESASLMGIRNRRKMINIDAKKVIETRIAENMGFDKYKQIMEMVRKTDVSSDPDFQRTFRSG